MSNDGGGQRALRGRVHATKRKSRAALERDLHRLAGRVEELELERERLEAFAAVAAHELLEPLIMAEAFASIVADRLDGDDHVESRRDLEAIARGVSRGRVLVEALLQDARATGAGLTVRLVDLNRVAEECVTMLEPQVKLREARVTVGALPEVDGDELLLASVLTNLLANALKYNPRLGGEIRVSTEREAAAWRIGVTSDGPTIAEEDRERIFEPFNRARGERRVRGAGLGLAICRRIVERHGGQMGVVPARSPGGGNTFYFTLPA